jgi:hypothetical protein
MSSDVLSPQSASRVARPYSLYEWLIWLNNHDSAAIALLSIVNLACHWQTLGGYFLADDFVHVAWLQEVFNGRPDLLLKNFYSTWLQTEGTNFYRPFISVTLACDRALFGFSPLGYHITNFTYQCLSTIGLFLVVKECTFLFLSRARSEKPPAENSFDKQNIYASTILPLISATLFAVHPLHAEVVSWIIARVDSVCCAFYLLSMWLFLKARRTASAKKTQYKILCCLFYLISLISKEMAVTLPPALVLLLVLFPQLNEGEAKSNFPAATAKAFIATWQLWLILIIYAVVRTLALGSVTGGYQGSIGEGLSESTLSRVFSWASAQRVIFPLNAEVFDPVKRLAKPLTILYGITLALFFARFLYSKNRFIILKTIAFAALWFLLVMIPTIPVWNLTESLQGSRFIYMGTAPLCLLISAFLSPIWNFQGATTDNGKPGVAPTKVALSALSAVLAVALAALYGFIAFGNNAAWVSAGAELRTLRDALDREVKSIPPSDDLALLNLPHKYKGAHMLYNAATLSVLLAPPLNETNIFRRVRTFEPVLFGDDDLIRISRVRQLLQPGSKTHFVFWDRDDEKLVALKLKGADAEIKLDQNCQELKPIDVDARGNPIAIAGEKSIADRSKLPLPGGHRAPYAVQLLTPALDIQPASVDFLDICLSATSNSTGTAGGSIPFVVRWSGAVSLKSNDAQNLVTAVPADGKLYRIRIHVSEHKKWLSRGEIHRLAIESPQPQASVTVHGMSILSGSNRIPVLQTAGNFSEDESGVTRAGGKVGRFSFDARNVAGASGTLFEISKPDAWFEHYTNTYRDASACARALKTWTRRDLHAVAQEFSLKDLGGAGFYELRMAAVGPSGEVVGYFSDPIMFQLSH